MKNYTRRISALLFALSLIFSLCVSAAAATLSPTDDLVVQDLMALVNVDNKAMSYKQKENYKAKFNSLSDQDFDDIMVYLASTTSDYKKLQATLASVGVELGDESVSAIPKSTYKVPAKDVTLYAASSKRLTDTYYRLYGYFKLNSRESKPGSYDVLALYFNSNNASYYSYNNSTYTSLRSGQKATAGTVVFNYYDCDDTKGNTLQYVAVYVTRKAAGWLDYGVDWVHTYTVKSTSTTDQSSISFGGVGGVTGSVGLSVTTSTEETSWSLADTNAVNFS